MTLTGKLSLGSHFPKTPKFLAALLKPSENNNQTIEKNKRKRNESLKNDEEIKTDKKKPKHTSAEIKTQKAGLEEQDDDKISARPKCKPNKSKENFKGKLNCEVLEAIQATNTELVNEKTSELTAPPEEEPTKAKSQSNPKILLPKLIKLETLRVGRSRKEWFKGRIINLDRDKKERMVLEILGNNIHRNFETISLLSDESDDENMKKSSRIPLNDKAEPKSKIEVMVEETKTFRKENSFTEEDKTKNLLVSRSSNGDVENISEPLETEQKMEVTKIVNKENVDVPTIDEEEKNLIHVTRHEEASITKMKHQTTMQPNTESTIHQPKITQRKDDFSTLKSDVNGKTSLPCNTKYQSKSDQLKLDHHHQIKEYRAKSDHLFGIDNQSKSGHPAKFDQTKVEQTKLDRHIEVDQTKSGHFKIDYLLGTNHQAELNHQTKLDRVKADQAKLDYHVEGNRAKSSNFKIDYLLRTDCQSKSEQAKLDQIKVYNAKLNQLKIDQTELNHVDVYQQAKSDHFKIDYLLRTNYESKLDNQLKVEELCPRIIFNPKEYFKHNSSTFVTDNEIKNTVDFTSDYKKSREQTSLLLSKPGRPIKSKQDVKVVPKSKKPKLKKSAPPKKQLQKSKEKQTNMKPKISNLEIETVLPRPEYSMSSTNNNMGPHQYPQPMWARSCKNNFEYQTPLHLPSADRHKIGSHHPCQQFQMHIQQQDYRNHHQLGAFPLHQYTHPSMNNLGNYIPLPEMAQGGSTHIWAPSTITRHPLHTPGPSTIPTPTFSLQSNTNQSEMTPPVSFNTVALNLRDENLAPPFTHHAHDPKSSHTLLQNLSTHKLFPVSAIPSYLIPTKFQQYFQ